MSKKLTLKEELEILRGEPIQVFTGDPLDIPCIETSDPERLCKHPVVSVNMVTYNHELYIRQAIEGVMMQKTDFEFELVIGEDCSTDKTRDICFEYQKRYPDKIRVLWCDHNLYRNPHPAGANGERNMAHCRGEFIALCEGDDYWIDPLKLQKQVDVMRKYPNVGFCFCGSKILEQSTGKVSVWNEGFDGFAPGIIPSLKYVLYTMFGKNPLRGWHSEFWQMTATFLVRQSTLMQARTRYEIFKWALSVGDATFCIGCGSCGDVYYVGDNVSVYRRSATGITVASGGKCGVDTLIVRMFFARKFLGLKYAELPDFFVKSFVDAANDYLVSKNNESIVKAWRSSDLVVGFTERPIFALQRILGFDIKRSRKCARWIYYYTQFLSGFGITDAVQKMYSSANCNIPRHYRNSCLTYFYQRIRRKCHVI